MPKAGSLGSGDPPLCDRKRILVSKSTVMEWSEQSKPQALYLRNKVIDELRWCEMGWRELSWCELSGGGGGGWRRRLEEEVGGGGGGGQGQGSAE